MQWCCQVETFKRFVDAYIRDQESEGYLQLNESGATTSLDALAHVFNFCVCVWQRKEDNPCDLKVIRWVNEGDSEVEEKEIIHVLWNGDVHFDRLDVVEN